MPVLTTAVRVEETEPIYRVRFERRFAGNCLHSVCVHLVDGLLVDTGCAHTVPELLQALADRQPEQLVNTHHHEDHIGGNHAVAARYGLQPQIHPLGLPYLQYPGAIQFYRVWMWGRPHPSTGVALGSEVKTGRYRWRVLHTPGHALDHVALYEEQQGWLLSGDLFLSARPRSATFFDDFWQILKSLRVLQALDFERLYCCHGPPLSGPAARQALQERVRYWEYLAEEAPRLAAAGLSTRAIRRRLLGREGVMGYCTLGQISKTQLIRLILQPPEHSRADGGAGWALPTGIGRNN